MKKHHGNHFMLGAMLGSAVGAVSAVLFSKKGRSIQKNAKHKINQFENYIKGLMSKEKKPSVKSKKMRKAAPRKRKKLK